MMEDLSGTRPEAPTLSLCEAARPVLRARFVVGTVTYPAGQPWTDSAAGTRARGGNKVLALGR